MGTIKKDKRSEIVKLMLQEIPTEEIAKKLNYSVSTIRKVFEELREEYGVNTKTGVAVAYLKDKIVEHLIPLLNLTDTSNFATCFKSAPKKKNNLNLAKNKKSKNNNKNSTQNK